LLEAAVGVEKQAVAGVPEVIEHLLALLVATLLPKAH